MPNTIEQYDKVLAECADVFKRKLADYGASWRVMRPASITDQIFIKALRIRTLQENGGHSLVGEGILPEFKAIVNYGIMGMIQLGGYRDSVDDSDEQEKAEVLKAYDREVKAIRELMVKKNHDYGEAWRSMRVSSFVDIILTKIMRIKQIEDNQGVTKVSEGIGSNYQDIINYAIFGVIKEEE